MDALLYILHLKNGHLKIVKELINNRANLNQPRTDNGATPLYIASRNGHLEIVKELINNCANLNQATTDGTTPLFIASQNRYLEIVKELINNGANLNQATTDYGCTPLYIASQKGHLEMVKELINNGANANAICIIKQSQINKNARGSVLKDVKYSFSPIYIAWWIDKEEIVSILKDISDIELNIQLAKQNNHPKALKFFRSLLQEQK